MEEKVVVMLWCGARMLVQSVGAGCWTLPDLPFLRVGGDSRRSSFGALRCCLLLVSPHQRREKTR